MRLVLVGPPGAGKGTQAEFIAEHFGVPKISTGDIFRANVSGGTDLGRLAKKYMDAGDLVPDEVTVAMVRDRLAQPDATAGFLLDGFPRNTAQAEQLNDILAEIGAPLSVVLDLEVEHDEVVRGCPGAAPARSAGTSGTWSTTRPRSPACATGAGASSTSATTTAPGRCGTVSTSTPSRRRR